MAAPCENKAEVPVIKSPSRATESLPTLSTVTLCGAAIHKEFDSREVVAVVRRQKQHSLADLILYGRPACEQSEGKVVRRGSVMVYLECEITDEQGRLVAKASSTCMALSGERAKRR